MTEVPKRKLVKPAQVLGNFLIKASMETAERSGVNVRHEYAILATPDISTRNAARFIMRRGLHSLGHFSSVYSLIHYH